MPAADKQSPGPSPGELWTRYWPWIAVAAVLGIQLLGLATVVSHARKNTGGLSIFAFFRPYPSVGAETEQARQALEKLPGYVSLREVNGHRLRPDGTAQQAMALVDTRTGATNSYLLQDTRGATHRVRLQAGPIQWSTILRWFHWRVMYWVVGLLYLLLGLFVWRSLPNDRGARAFLMVMLVPPAHSVLGVHAEPGGTLLLHLQVPVFPFYAVTLLNFALVFTGAGAQRSWQRLRWGSLALCLLLAAGLVSVFHLRQAAVPWTFDAAKVLFGVNSVHLGLSVLSVMAVTWRVARGDGPAALRRRANVLGWAALISFLFPSAWSFFGHLVPNNDVRIAGVVLMFSMLGLFPVMMVYAIMRLHMFSLRVVLSQGVVYGAMSVVISLIYVAVILAVHRVAGSYQQLPLVSAVSLLAFVLLFSVLKVRVQEAVDRLVFRSRYVYSDAITTASARLARAQGMDAVRRAVRLALVEGMGLSRVYLALWDKAQPTLLRSITISSADAASDEAQAVPQTFAPGDLPPVERAIDTRAMTTAYDRQALEQAPAALAHQGCGDCPACEAEVWPSLGLECVVPLVGHEANSRVVGLLLLGPKRSGQPLDPGDQQLLSTLSNQLAMAVENSLAFEEIRRLKEGLEEQVAGRTSELTHTLMELHETQAQLIDNQTNATLARVVAGVVHEINSPLGVMRSSTNTIGRVFTRCKDYLGQQAAAAAEPAANGAGRKLLRSLEKGDAVIETMDLSGERIASVVNSLQKFVSLDEAEHKVVDVRDGLDSTLLLLKPRLEGRVELELSYPDEPTRISCFPAILNQVFLKLLENAVDAMDRDSGARITIKVEAGMRWVKLSIADNGRGIPKKQIPRLFEFGFTRKSGGRMGLRMGLAYCKSSIDKIGGRLAIDTEEGKGTTVRIKLPAA